MMTKKAKKKTKLIPLPPKFDDLMNGNSNFSIDDRMTLVPDNFNENELLLSITDIPNMMPDNLTCAILILWKNYKNILIQIIEKWPSDTSRLIITMGIYQKEQLKYLENIQYTVNTHNQLVMILLRTNIKNKTSYTDISNNIFGNIIRIG